MRRLAAEPLARRTLYGVGGGAAIALAVVTLVGGLLGSPVTGATLGGHGAATQSFAATSGVRAAVGTLDTTTTTSPLSLGITAAPSAICANGDNACTAGAGEARVTLSANAGGAGQVSWPAVQVAFVIETTLYDGVYDPSAGEPGSDPCSTGSTSAVPCEESNGVPFFVANAQAIASEISAANPHTTVSFALVDYFATLTDWDDGDGAEYHVDIATFVPATEFGADVKETFQQEVLNGNLYYSDSDFADNFLHSSSITALYGTIIGTGLNWANDTHHVIVWMGSTAPRDPNYPVNYCVSGSVFASFVSGSCYGATCEPAYRFSTGTSPACEGWVRSQDGNNSHSIAQLAHEAPSCTKSIGGDCTIDTIDYWNTPTDPYSKGWPAGRTNGGPGGVEVLKTSAHIIQAGCDLAAATGGTWSGPAWATCPDGQTGSLQYVEHGSYTSPTTTNPTLLSALRGIGFGPVTETQVASGTGQPIFAFMPIGSIALAPDLQATSACLRGGAIYRTCQTTPTILHSGSVTYLGWNWSTNKTSNIMYIGDSWTASFNVVAVGPPYALVPVDACITTECKGAGSGAVNNIYTWASYVPATNNSVVTESFPLAEVRVQIAPPAPVASTPPPPPPAPPPFAIISPAPLTVPQQVGIGNSVGIGTVSLQAAAAGFLGAGFMRVGMKNRPIAMRVAAKSGTVSSKFDAASREGAAGVGRFE